MPEQPDDFNRLRKMHYSLEDLPDTISFPAPPGREAGAPVALEQRRHGEFDFIYLAIKRDQPVAADAAVPSVQPLAAA